MRIEKLLQEIVSPKKPEHVKSSTFRKAGVQGSHSNVRQRQFTTSKGNDVKVLFDVQNDSDGKFVDINFYVNDTHYDDASTSGKEINNDFEILSGVLYLAKRFVNYGKYDRIKFEAQKGSGDQKVVRGINLAPIKGKLSNSVQELKKDIESYEPTQEQIRAAKDAADRLSKKVNKTIRPVVIYKEELRDIVEKINKFVNSNDPDLEEGYWLISQLQRYDKTVETFNSYKQVEKLFREFLKGLESNDGEGVLVHKNRRQSLYSKLVNKYFPEWNVEIYGNTFELTRNDSHMNHKAPK